MRKFLLSIILAVTILSTNVAFADKKDLTEVEEEGRVKITWQSPQDYRDIRPSNQSRKSFRKQIFSEFNEELEELAESLPEGQVLEMTFTDIDLAGQVWPGSFVGIGHGADDIRLVERIHIPRLEFSYTLKDAGGNEIKTDEIDIKDMNFLDRASIRFRERPFPYEKRMLREWFNEEFQAEVAKL